MAAYHSIILQQFRSYGDYSTELTPGVNIVVGPNGSGKTNLLEALYVLSAGSSFRAADRDLVQHGREWFRLEGLCGEQQRIFTCRVRADGSIEKSINLDGSKKARMTHQQRTPVVLFEPDHLRLLHGGRSARRDYMDDLLIKLYPDYAWLKHQFERVLLQRNAVLKRRLPRGSRTDQLFAWDVKFAELSAQVVMRRRELLTKFAAEITSVYSAIASSAHQVDLAYECSVPGPDYHASLLKQLHELAERDSERGFTTVGPHRDDFAVKLDHSPAAAAASRGEIRTLLLAFKIIELRLLSAQQEATPLLLLDDVFSELDAARRQSLAGLAQTYQTIITTTDADAVVEHFLDGYNIIATEKAA